MANPNPFLRSPTDALVDELNAQAALPITLPQASQPDQDQEYAPRAVSLPTDQRLPAGMRNNNPGNIKYVGQRDAIGPSENRDQGDPQAVYATPEDGMAATFRLALRKYNSGKTTTNSLIASQGGWTPGNTQAAANIARTMGLSPDDDLNLRDPAQMARFGRALFLQEHGQASQAYTDDMIARVAAGVASGKTAKAGTAPRAQQPDLKTFQQQLDADEHGRYKVLDQQPEQADLAQFQKDLDGDEAGRYKVLTADYAATHFSPALMDRGAYEQTFRQNNPGASQAAVDYAMGEYDKQATQRAAAPTVETRFKVMQDPNALFDQRLNQKLAGRGVGIVPSLPDVNPAQQQAAQQQQPAQQPAFDAAKAEEESGVGAAGSYLGRSLQSGVYDLMGAGAKILDEINPWTLSPGDAAVLFKDDPAKLKQFQDDSASMVLSRFANAMSKNSEEATAAMSDRAKRDYGSLEYATLDQDKAAYRSPVKVIGDAVRSLPTTVAMAVSVYLTRGAALQAEKNALAAGLGEEAARRAGIEAGAKVMSQAGAVSEGATGYAQQANQSSYEASKLSIADMAKSPKFQQLLKEGFTPETARAKIIADTGEEAGQIAGIVDATVNKFGGEFLGKILTEGGKLVPRIMKGAANESATEFVQSAGEQVGQNLSTQQNINPNQSLSQGVGEAAVAGAAVGGLMGGTAAGAGGAGHVATPAAQPGAQPAAPVTVPPTQVQPVPAAVAPTPKSATPLTASLEGVAEQPQRVIATTPDGQVAAGTVQDYREDGDGNFIAKIVGDDGQVYTVTDEDGVQLVPVEAPQGPLTASLETAADQHAAEQTPVVTPQAAPEVAEAPAAAPIAEQPAAPAAESAPFVPSAPPVPTAPADMTDEQLRTRMQYLAGQFKGAVDRGVQKKIALERRAIEKEINARAQAAQPTEEVNAPGITENVAGAGATVGRGRGDRGTDRNAAIGQPGPVPTGDRMGLAGHAGEPVPAAGKPSAKNLPAATAAANGQPALSDEHAGKEFISDSKARAYIAKNRIGTTHYVKRVKPGEFEIRRRPGAGATMGTAADKIAKQEEAVRQAAENIAARAAAKAAQGPQTELDSAAHEAATSPTNDLPEPTAAQKEAGNYKKGHIQVQGMDITVENPRGSTRSGQRPDGSTWSHEMSDHYGYIKRTEGADGEQVDVYVGPKPESDRVFVVDQLNQGDGSFDEHKAMLGYGNKQAALRAYKSNFDKGWKVGPVRQMSIDEFKAWIKDGDTTRPVAEHQTEANPTIQGERNGIDQRTEQQPNGAEETAGQQETKQASAGQEAGKADVLTQGAENATEEIAQQGSVQPERAHRGQGRQASETGGRNRVQRAASSEEEAAREVAATKQHPAPREVPAAEQAAPAAPIADFGEKIHGARKDVWTGFRESMQEALPENVKDITLAKHFPEPNYEKLIEAGVDPKVLAAFKAMRDAIPAKPRLPYKAKRWGEQVTTLRNLANNLLDGTQSVEGLLTEMRHANGQLRQFAERIEMYAGLGYPLFTKAKDYSLEQHHYTMFNGESPPGGVTKWELERDGRRSAYFDTQEEGIAALRKGLENAEDKVAGKKVDLDMYRVTSNGDIVIGKKVAPGKFIDLKTGFQTVREARAYLAEHRDELLDLLEKKKDVRPERRSVNDPRVGIDRRQGADITPDTFGGTFGFRGVQFGNYVEQKRRGADLNNAYDALLDLADTLGVPPRALSLNGTLGLAFGARGKGGKNPAAAHYEPGQTVINLTKTAGAGSLAHEWWHGLDNYFAKLRSKDGSFVTQSPRQKMVPDQNNRMVPDTSIRAETLDAFKGVVDAIRSSGMLKRSRELDNRRTKDYWSTIEELTARAFESYVIDKATEQGYSNDYLANIVSEQAHDAMNGLAGEAEPYPYPLRSEAPAINAAFDKLFATLETREQDGKVALYSVTGEDVASAIDRLMREKSGEATVDVPGVGDVTIPYGDSKSGLAHIARRRGENFIPRVIDLLQHGQVYEKEGQKGRVFLGHGADEAVLSLDRNGKAGTWLLSAYEKYPDLKAARLSEVTEERMQDGKYFTKEDLQRSLTSRGILGQVIASMIDAGVVKLHGGPGKLPGKARGVKGVQAVTMPDGTIHMVASNLTPRTAFPVLMHEMFHQGGEKLIGTKEWGNLMGRLGSLYRQSEQSSGKAREFYDRARARVEAARRKGAVGRAMEVEEFAAYAIEEYEKSRDSLPAAIRKWVEDLIGVVKTWLVKNYGKQIGQVTPAQLAAMARWAVMDVAAERRGEIFGKFAERFSAGTDQTDTPAFQRWFGDSKVVDENGAPLVVYHGTDASFEKFGAIGTNFPEVSRGFYFTSDPKAASKYADDVSDVNDGENANVVPVYLRIEKPLTINGSDWDIDDSIDDLMAQAESEGADGIIATGKSGAKTFIAFKPEQIKSAIGNNGDFDPTNPDIRYSVAADDAAVTSAEPIELTPPEQGTLRSIQAAVQDSQNRVKQVQDRITKLAGRTIGEKADYYLAETNRPGRIAPRLEDAQNHLFQPLMARLAKSGFTQEQLSSLLHAQHAEERNAAVANINTEMPDGGSGMTNDEAQAILKLYENDAELHAIAQQARDITHATLDLKLAYGLLKKDDYDMLTGMYEHYVPLKGDGEYGPKIKRAMGHDEREEHILENIARDYQQAVVVGEKNLARQSLLRLVLQNPDPSLWTVGVPPKGRYVAGKVYAIFKGNEKVASFTSAAQVQAFLEDRGANAGYTVRDSAGEQVKEFAKPLQDNEVMVYVKGDPVRIQIGDEKLARQLRPIIESRDLTRWFVEKMRTLNRFKAAVYTGRNPAFILRNMARDAMTGTINMTGHHGAQVAAKAWARYPAAFRAMFQYAASGKVPAGELGGYMTEYRQHGGKVGASHMSDLEAQGKTLTRMFDDAYGAGGFLREGRVGKASWVASRKLIGGLAHGIEVVNQAAENALRLSLYATLREGGATPAKAAQAAKTVTVDFDRKGEATGILGALYLFINPAIQGTANMVRTMATGEHKAQAWALVGALTLAGMLTAGANMDDDKERWLGEEWDTRTKNYIRYFGKHKVSIPLSQEYSPFYAAGAAIAEGRRGESAMKSSLRLFSSFLDAYFPLQGAFHPESDNHAADLAMATVPTAIRPHVESAFNRNSFGSQIVPENEQTKNRPDNLKMNRSTKGTVYDKAAQAIADAGSHQFDLLGGWQFAGKYENDITKVSPETLKHLWRTYTGGLGQFITDSAGLAALAGEDLSQVESSDVPIVKDFVKPQDVKPLRGRYYDLAKEAKSAQEEFRQAKKAGDAEAMDKILGDARKAELLSLAKTVTTTNKAAAELADEKVDVLADDSLNTAQKREKLKAIEQEEEALYRDAIDAFK